MAEISRPCRGWDAAVVMATREACGAGARNPTVWVAGEGVQGWVCSPPLPLGPHRTPKLWWTPLIPKLTTPPIFQQAKPGENHRLFHGKQHLQVKKCAPAYCREHTAKLETPAASCLPLPCAKILSDG